MELHSALLSLLPFSLFHTDTHTAVLTVSTCMWLWVCVSVSVCYGWIWLWEGSWRVEDGSQRTVPGLFLPSRKKRKEKTGTRWTTEALLKNKIVVFLRRAELRKTLMRLPNKSFSNTFPQVDPALQPRELVRVHVDFNLADFNVTLMDENVKLLVVVVFTTVYFVELRSILPLAWLVTDLNGNVIYFDTLYCLISSLLLF